MSDKCSLSYQKVKLSDITTFKTGKLNSNAAVKNGIYPFFTCSQDIFRTNTCSFDTECVLLGGNNANGIYPLNYFKGKFDVYQRTYVIRSKDENRLINRYLYYDLSLKLDFLKSISTGAATKFLTKTILDDLEIDLPPLPTQKKITAILSAYDDLIKNNTQRIKILEEMAQALYREWFVEFRFPGHEDVEMVDDGCGRMIPEGWELIQVLEIMQIHRGRSYKSENLVENGGLPFINLKCIERDGGFRRDGLKGYSGPYKESHKVKTGDIVIAVTDMTQERRLVARAAMIPSMPCEFGIISMDLVKIEPKITDDANFLYGMLRYSSFPDIIKQHANGANVLHLKPDAIGQFEFLLPPPKLRNQYSDIFKSINSENNCLENKILNLQQTRDLLLPRLIEGEVDVSDIDIAITQELGIST